MTKGVGLVIVAWHGLLVAAYEAAGSFVPEGASGGCADYVGRCLEPRAGYTFVGLAVGVPAMAVSLVVAVFSVRRLVRVDRSTVRVGSLAAWTGILLTAGALLVLGLAVGILTAA